MQKHSGEAEHMKKGGADETSGKRQNAPFRQLHEGGHMLNHGYKNPSAKISLDLEDNPSYMHPHDSGNGHVKPATPPRVWDRANSIKPMEQQGPGKTGAPKVS